MNQNEIPTPICNANKFKPIVSVQAKSDTILGIIETASTDAIPLHIAENLEKQLTELRGLVDAALKQLQKTEFRELHEYDHKYHCFSCGGLKVLHEKCETLKPLTELKSFIARHNL